MSAESYCVTSGICAHDAPRCSAVLRRTPRIGWRSISPHLLKSGSGSAARRAAAAPAAGAAGADAISRFACAFTSSIEMRPSSPVPTTSSMSTPSSRAMRRTDGAAGAEVRPSDGGSTARSARRARNRRPCRPGPVRLRSRRLLRSEPLCRGRRLSGARLRRRLASAASARRGRPGGRGAVVDAEDRLADFDLVAGFDFDVFDFPGDRRGHFDRRLVGFELEDRLIFRQRVAGLTSTRSTSPAAMFSPSSGSVKSAIYDTAGFGFSGLMPSA